MLQRLTFSDETDLQDERSVDETVAVRERVRGMLLQESKADVHWAWGTTVSRCAGGRLSQASRVGRGGQEAHVALPGTALVKSGEEGVGGRKWEEEKRRRLSVCLSDD